MLRVGDPGSELWNLKKLFSDTDLDPRVKKAPDPDSQQLPKQTYRILLSCAFRLRKSLSSSTLSTVFSDTRALGSTYCSVRGGRGAVNTAVQYRYQHGKMNKN
jgi:hypothetical protein